MAFEIVDMDFGNEQHCGGLLEVLDAYAAGPEGGGSALPSEVRARLLPALREHVGTVVLLALAEGQVVGIATCFVGFSTFYAKPLLNVHDLAVLPAFQRRGIARALLTAAEERARARGCCKLTLEVREDNHRARALYHERGFRDFELAGKQYPTLFLAKPFAVTEAG